MQKPAADIIRILLVGGSVRLDAAQYSTEDLIRIVMTACDKAARIHIFNSDSKSIEDLIRVATVGKDCVMFE
jgi:DNA replication protein